MRWMRRFALGHGSAAARDTATAWRAGFSPPSRESTAAFAAPHLGGLGDPAVQATLEWFHGFAASDFGDPSVAEAMVGRALAGFRALGDQWGIAAALSTRAKLGDGPGQPPRGQW